MQHTIQALNHKLSEQITESTFQLRAFAQVKQQAAEFTTQKLQEIINQTSHMVDKDNCASNMMFLNTQGLQAFNNFGLTSPMSGARCPVKKLDINGAE